MKLEYVLRSPKSPPSLHVCSHGFDSDLTIRVALVFQGATGGPSRPHTPSRPQDRLAGGQSPSVDGCDPVHSLTHSLATHCVQSSDSESWATAERLPVWGPSRGGGVLFGVELGPKLKHGITDGKICVFCLFFIQVDFMLIKKTRVYISINLGIIIIIIVIIKYQLV